MAAAGPQAARPASPAARPWCAGRGIVGPARARAGQHRSGPPSWPAAAWRAAGHAGPGARSTWPAGLAQDPGRGGGHAGPAPRTPWSAARALVQVNCRACPTPWPTASCSARPRRLHRRPRTGPAGRAGRGGSWTRWASTLRCRPAAAVRRAARCSAPAATACCGRAGAGRTNRDLAAEPGRFRTSTTGCRWAPAAGGRGPASAATCWPGRRLAGVQPATRPPACCPGRAAGRGPGLRASWTCASRAAQAGCAAGWARLRGQPAAHLALGLHRGLMRGAARGCARAAG
jgi:hypothetical protein